MILVKKGNSIQLTSVRFESLKRDGLLVVIILVLPHIVTASCADLASVVDLGHFKPPLLNRA